MKVSFFVPKAAPTRTLDSRVMARVSSLLELKMRNAIDMVRAARSGVPVAAVNRLIEAGVSQKDLVLVINPTMLRRRETNNQALTPEESGRWFRIAMAQALAIEVLGSEDKAARWLRKPRAIFDGLSAMDLMRSETGTPLIDEALRQLDAGYFA